VLHLRSGDLSVAGPDTVSGCGNSGRGDGADGVHYCFYAKFSKPVAGYRTWNGSNVSLDAAQSGSRIGFSTDYTARAGQQIEVRVGFSYISAEQAQKNLDHETPPGDSMP
jgi:putative alpha-1,2-mannosidase